jgi:radical SAM protein with 4Fe4S-binding SPASM domain
METPEREERFDRFRGEGWEEGYRAYRTNWTTYARDQHVSEYPLLVDVELSSTCNLKCPMCYTVTEEFKRKVNTGFMGFDLYRKIIDEIGDKVPALRLSLRGEPTLHEYFVESIRYAKSKGIREVSFLTNGSKMAPRFFEQVLEAGADWITISFDGLGETYESIRRPLKFDRVFQRIKDIKRIKDQHRSPKPVIKVQSIWPAIRENPTAYYETFAPLVDLVAYNPLIDYLGKDRDIVYEDDFSCPQLYQRLVVGSEGIVMMCANDEENTVIVGDVRNETIHEIWHGESLKRTRDLHKQRKGFLESKVCRACYLPRLTEDTEIASVQGREFIVRNYVNRDQQIGA